MKKLLLALFALPLFFACNKKDDECTLSSGAVAGTYRITAVKYKASAAAPEQDYYNVVFTDACEKDDTYTLNSNGTFAFNDAGVKCVPPNDFTGTWSLNGNTITIDGDAGNVDSFSCTVMVVSASNVFTVGDKFTVTYTRV
jgi:hypothetical protein